MVSPAVLLSRFLAYKVSSRGKSGAFDIAKTLFTNTREIVLFLRVPFKYYDASLRSNTRIVDTHVGSVPKTPSFCKSSTAICA